MACPVRKVMKTGAGSGAARHAGSGGGMVAAVRRGRRQRAGDRQAGAGLPAATRRGACWPPPRRRRRAAVCLHPRSRAQLYRRRRPPLTLRPGRSCRCRSSPRATSHGAPTASVAARPARRRRGRRHGGPRRLGRPGCSASCSRARPPPPLGERRRELRHSSTTTGADLGPAPSAICGGSGRGFGRSGALDGAQARPRSWRPRDTRELS